MKLSTCPSCPQALHFERFQGVLSEPAVEKLRSVHRVIEPAAEAS